MADKAHTASDDDATEGTMDISEHVKTWLAFWKGVQYSAAGVLLLAALLAIFRTHNGY